jgi:hypothetical protein
MSNATHSRVVSEVAAKAGNLSAPELNAVAAGRARLTDLSYKTSEVDTLLAACTALALAASTATVLADMTATIAALAVAAAISSSAGAE